MRLLLLLDNGRAARRGQWRQRRGEGGQTRWRRGQWELTVEGGEARDATEARTREFVDGLTMDEDGSEGLQLMEAGARDEDGGEGARSGQRRGEECDR